MQKSKIKSNDKITPVSRENADLKEVECDESRMEENVDGKSAKEEFL